MSAPTAPLPGRLPGLDLLRGLAVLFLFNLAFFGPFMEARFHVPAGPDPAHRLWYAAQLSLATPGLVAMDVLFVLCGYLASFRIDTGAGAGFGYLARRYARMLPVLLAVNVPVYVYAKADVAAVAGSLAGLRLFAGGGFAYQIMGGVNAFVLFAFAAAIWKACAARLPWAASPWAAGLAWAAAAGLVASGALPVWLNFHGLGFFAGVLAGRLHREHAGRPWPPGLIAALRLLSLAGLLLWSHLLWRTKGDEWLPALTGTGPAVLARIAVSQALAVLAVAAFAAGTRRPAGAGRPLERLGAMSLSFYAVSSLYAPALGRALAVDFASPYAAMLWLYGVTLACAVAVAAVFFRFLESGRAGSSPGCPAAGGS